MILATVVEVNNKLAQIPAAARAVLIEELNKSAINIDREAKRALSNSAPPAVDTGQLRRSVHIAIQDGGEVAQIGTASRHGLYVEYGTAPHFPPVNALIPWVKRHKGKFGLKMGRAGTAARGSFESHVRSIAFLIARAISRRGTKARPWLLPAFNKERAALIRRMKAALRRLQ